MDQDKLNSLLNEGIAAARSGQAAQARDLLMQVVEADENNESAWLWLSGVVESLKDRQVCLENVLALNPDSVAAQKGLAWIDQQRASQGVSLEAASPAETPPPSTPELDAPPAAYQAATPAQPAPPPATAIPPVTAAAPLVRYERQRKREKRSGPLIIVSIGWILYSLMILLIAAVLLIGLAFLSSRIPTSELLSGLPKNQQEEFGSAFLVGASFLGILFLIWGGLCVALAVGLLKRIKIAWYASFAVAFITLGFSVFAFIANSTISRLCEVLIPIGMMALTFLARDDFAMEEVIVQEKRAEYGTDSPLQHYQRGLEYAKEKKLDMAIQEWEKAVALDPANLRFRNALALALAGVNQHPRAITVLEEALKAFPSDRETKSNLEAIKRAAAKKG
jgi:tetratricopeptide (TPR) repeat protein